MKFSQFLAESGPVGTKSKNEIKFIPWDANYFSRGAKNRDCVIRALCMVTNYGYKKLMEMFGKKFMFGHGYPPGESGISLDEIDKFADETGIIEKIWGGDDGYSELLDKIGIVSDYDNLQSFINNDLDEIMEYNNIKLKRFVFVVKDTKKEPNDPHHYHMTPVIWYKDRWTCFDLPTIKNIQDSIPICCYAVKKVVKNNSPDSYINEREREKKAFQDYWEGLRKSQK